MAVPRAWTALGHRRFSYCALYYLLRTSGNVGSTSARCRWLAGCVLWAWAAAASLLRHRKLDFHAPPCKRCWRRLMPNFEPTACGMHSTDTGGWKLWRGLLGALGKDEPVSHAAAATR